MCTLFTRYCVPQTLSVHFIQETLLNTSASFLCEAVFFCFVFFSVKPCEGEHVGHLPERAQLPTDCKTERHRRVPEDCFVAFSVTVVVQFLRVLRRQVSWGWCPNLANVTLVDALFYLSSCLCRSVGMTRNGSADPTHNRNCYSLVPT